MIHCQTKLLSIMKKSYFLIVFLFAACKYAKPDCEIIANELLKNDHDKVHMVLSERNRILGIADNRYDNKGGAYYFYENGKLKSYKFFQTDSAYNYAEEYDENGLLTRVIGKPLIDTRIREVNIDSALITYCLFSLHKEYQNVKVSASNALNSTIDLKNDTFYSNVKIGSFGMNTKGLRDFKIYFSCEYNNKCTPKSGTIADTLSFVKNPGLNLLDNN
jgi:hypothetical protein